VVVNNGEPIDLERDGVRLVEANGNTGFGAGCNLGTRHVTSEVLAFLNPDTVARPGALRALADVLADDSIACVQPRLRLLATPDLLNSAGNVLHVSGLAWPGGFGDRADDVRDVREIAYASGAAFAIRADVFRELGGFTEELFLYQEDLDLSWRAWLRGRRVVVTPTADVLHDYVVERPGRRKEYYLERNRLVFVLTAYSARLLALALPVVVAVELGIVVVAAREGWLGEKLKGWLWLVRHRGWLRARRRRLQSTRTVADRSLARLFTPIVHLEGMVEQPRGMGLLNVAVRAWWALIRVLL
jgi:GT2 family glycosyltransferase